jgi:hypothetical protein
MIPFIPANRKFFLTEKFIRTLWNVQKTSKPDMVQNWNCLESSRGSVYCLRRWKFVFTFVNFSKVVFGFAAVKVFFMTF